MRVLILDLDTLRPDHLGCYGYHRNTSPNIDKIAAAGVRFNNYYSSDAPCLPARAALMTGMFGIHNGAIGHGGTAADLRLEGPERGFSGRMRFESLPAIAKLKGMHTTLISPFAARHGAWWFYAGFKEMHNTGGGGSESAEVISPIVMDWIDRKGGDDDWLLHINYWDPHTPYRAPEDFGNPFADDPLPEWLNEDILAKHRDKAGPHSAQEVAMYDNSTRAEFPRQMGEVKDMADLRRHIDGYDCGIRYMDEHIGRILDALEAKGVLDDTAIIVTSDHGENHGELGIYGEHATADYITCRIPMLVKWPGGMAGHVDDGFHYNLDLAPTLCDLLDGEPRERWDGKSYARTILKGDDCSHEYVVVSQGCHVCQRGVRFGDWMYMRTWHDGYHLFPDEMLFNIKDDPHEQNDLAESRPEIVREGAYLLSQWTDEMMATQPEGVTVDPMRTVLAEGGPFHTRGRLPEYCKRLEATGRGHHVAELKRRHPGEFE